MKVDIAARVVGEQEQSSGVDTRLPHLQGDLAAKTNIEGGSEGTLRAITTAAGMIQLGVGKIIIIMNLETIMIGIATGTVDEPKVQTAANKRDLHRHDSTRRKYKKKRSRSQLSGSRRRDKQSTLVVSTCLPSKCGPCSRK